jgi:hypothetical protein
MLTTFVVDELLISNIDGLQLHA